MSHHKASRVFATAMDRKEDAGFVLPTPIHALDALGSHPRSTDLVQWWWFNPIGFTFCALRLWDSDDGQHRLLGVAQWHPQTPDLVVYAAGLREQLMDPGALASAADGIFARYGRSARDAIMPTLPTGIDFRSANMTLPLLALRLRNRIEALAALEERRSLLSTCALLAASIGNPYQRCSMELLGADRSALAKLRELANDEDAADQLARDIEQIEAECATAVGGGGAPTEEDISQWWGLVTDHEHLDSERSLILDS